MASQQELPDSDQADSLALARELRDTFVRRSPALVALLAALKGEPPTVPGPRAKGKNDRKPAVAVSESEDALRFMLTIVVAYCNGAMQQQIATTYGVRVQTVRATLREAGVKVGEHNATFAEEELQIIRRLHADGMSARELGRRNGVAHTTILRQLR